MRAGGITVGPGDRIDGNRIEGCVFTECPAPQVVDNPSISFNRSSGVSLYLCPNAVVRGTRLVGNGSAGVWVRRGSDDAVIGPGVEVSDTRGTGIEIESASNAYIHGSVTTRNTTAGIGFLSDGRVLVPSTIVSGVIADNLGMGVVVRSSQAVRCWLCTVAGNYRGLYAAQLYRGSPSRIDGDSCVVWGNGLEDYNTTNTDGVVTLVNSFFRVPAPSGNGNRADDPGHVAAACGDYCLRGDSPAIDAGNAALSPGALDAYGPPRLAGARVDCGAHEV